METIVKARAGDPAAYNRIVLACRKKVVGTITRLIGRPEDAEDVAQEVFARLYFTLRNLRDPLTFETWLYRMTVNASYDYLRARRSRREAHMSDLSEPQLALVEAVAGTRADRAARERQRIRDSVEELLRAVSEQDRILLLLKEVEGLSLQDLEKIYHTSQNALRVRLFRARQRVLRACPNQTPDPKPTLATKTGRGFSQS